MVISDDVVDAQQVFKNILDAIIKQYYFSGADIGYIYQNASDHAVSRVDSSIGADIFMMPNNLNLNTEKTAGRKIKFY